MYAPTSDAVRYVEEYRDLARALRPTTKSQKSLCGDPTSVLTFLPGTLVWLSVLTAAPGLFSRLLPKYEGPYQVVKCASPLNYETKPSNRLWTCAIMDMMLST